MYSMVLMLHKYITIHTVVLLYPTQILQFYDFIFEDHVTINIFADFVCSLLCVVWSRISLTCQNCSFLFNE